MDEFENYSPADLEHLIIRQGKSVSAGFLSSGAHHEYKNFLSQIDLCTHYGLCAETVAEKNEALCMIQEYVEQAHETVAWLLEFISVEKDRPKTSYVYSSELSRCFDAIRDRCRRRTIGFHISRCSECKVLIDRHDLYQVLLTLAQYVFSIWPEDLGGEISLIEKSGNKQYMLNFVYTHCNAAHNKCSPFNPLPNKENDSGLYLYITKKMVIDAGGTLTFKKDSENAGFYLCLPIGNT